MDDPKAFIQLYLSLEAIAPVPIELMEMNDPDIKGYFSPKDQKIVLQPGLGEVMTLRTMIHEMTHAMLHTDSKQNLEIRRIADKSLKQNLSLISFLNI